MMVSCLAASCFRQRLIGLAFSLLLAAFGAVETGHSAALTFTNAAGITFLTGATAVPYPSQILVSNVPGLIKKITVNFTGLTHTYPGDVDALLVGPRGQKVMLLSDAGSQFNITNVSLNFDDAAPTLVSYTNAIVSGSFRPTDYEPSDLLTGPAPSGPYSAMLSVFDSTDPNGAWLLYILDDFPSVDGGTLTAWSVTIHYDFEVASSPREDFWVTDGPVYAMARRGDTLYLGGEFNALRRNPQATGVALDFNTLTPDPIFPPVKGVVRALAGDGEGGFYLGGDFTSVGGLPRTNLAHVSWDGNVTSWNPGANDTVLALALGDGTLYVGGEFSEISGQARARLATVSAATGQATTWNPNPDNAVKHLRLSGRNLFAVGDFLKINNVPRRFLAAWSTVNGGLLPWDPNPQGGGVAALVTLGDAVFVGGDFTAIGGTTRYGLAAVKGSSGLAFPWNPSGTNTENSVTALAIKGNTLYAGGGFTNLGGQTRRGLCALSVDSALALPWSPNLSNVPLGEIRSIAVSGDTVFVAGTFTNINGATRNGFAALDARTAAVRPQNFGLAFHPSVVGISEPTIYLGGAALDASVARHNLAAVDMRTGEPAMWNPGCNGPVSALLVLSNRVYVGGAFTNVSGFLRTNLAAVDAVSGVIDLNWIPHPNGEVLALARSPTGTNTVFVGGRFTSIGGQARNRIAALNNAGAATAWNPGADAAIHALAAAADGSAVLYVGGSFSNIAGVARGRLAALNEFTGTALTGNRDANGIVRALATAGSGAYAGGDFSNMGGQPHAFLALVDQVGTATNWTPVASGPVSSLAVATDQVFAGGSFTNLGGLERKGLVALSQSGGLPTDWNPAVATAVNSLLATENGVFAGGRFASLNNSFSPGLAAFAPALAPIITNQPSSRRVWAGSSTALSVGAIGEPPLAYKWRRDGVVLSSETNSSLLLPNVQSNAVGNYLVEVANSFGLVRSEIATVTLLSPPVISTQPVSQTVALGGTIALSVAVAGDPPPQILWRRNGTSIGVRSGSSLVVSNAQPTDGGRYDVLVMNVAGSVTSTSAVVQVKPPVSLSLSDDLLGAVLSTTASGVIVSSNINATSELGEPLHAGAPGGKSVWLSWLAPSNGLARFNTLGSDFDTLLAVYTTNGALTSVDGDDDGAGYHNSAVAFNALAGRRYWIAVDGLMGRVGSIALSWLVEPAIHVPVITQSPTNVVVPEGGTATFTVTATDGPGYLPLRYQWFRGQHAIENATNSTLLVTEAGPADLGEYTVFVINSVCGVVQSSWAFLELSSGLNVNRDVKSDTLVARNVSDLAGISLIRNRRLIVDPEEGTLDCFASSGLAEWGGWPITGTNSLSGSRTTTVPRTSAPLDQSLCGRAVWPEYMFGIDANISGVLFLRVSGAAVILSVVRLDNDGNPVPLSPPACAISSAPLYDATLQLPLVQGEEYVYSIVTPSGSVAPESVITEERIFCPHPGAPGYVVTRPTTTFQPFAYTNNGVLLSAQLTNLNPRCGQTLRWLRDGVPIPGESAASLFVPNSAGPGQYSLVVSNCAGAITNVVATLVQLEVFREVADGPLRLRSQPPTTAIFRVETATNLMATPWVWYPFFTNQPGQLLPVNLPTASNSNMLFRARPLPLN